MHKVIIGAVLGMALIPDAAFAQPPAGAILDSVELHENADCAWAEIRFQMPAGYLSHFPPAEGDQLRIDVRLLQQTEPFAEGWREAVRVRPRPPFNLQWVNFETGTFGRGTLYLDFSAATRFRIGAGRDGRSMLLSVPVEQDIAACDPLALQNRQ